MKVIGDVKEYNAKTEEEEVLYYGGRKGQTIEQVLMASCEFRQIVFTQPISVVSLQDVEPEEPSIEFVIQTEPGEKTVVYTESVNNEENAFYAEVIVLVVTDKQGNQRKFGFNREHYYLSTLLSDYPHLQHVHEQLATLYEIDTQRDSIHVIVASS